MRFSSVDGAGPRQPPSGGPRRRPGGGMAGAMPALADTVRRRRRADTGQGAGRFAGRQIPPGPASVGGGVAGAADPSVADLALDSKNRSSSTGTGNTSVE